MSNSRIGLLALLLSLLLPVSCGTGRRNDNQALEPWFSLRGVILAWDDVIHPESLDWIARMKACGLNTVSVCGHDYGSPEYAEMKQKFIDAGIDFEYEEHAMTYLLPKELFAEHPDYFRMDENGVRQADGNGCPSSEEGLQVIMQNVAHFAETHKPTNHKYYTWLFDGGDICHCPECKEYNASDQGLLFENHILEALKQIDPDARLAHLAYQQTTPPPTHIKPADGVFLEFAPFFRRWDRPLSDTTAIREGQKWSHGDYLNMLKDNLEVFPSETAQVLEYWMDVSQTSNWTKPQSKLEWHKDVFLSDLDTYAKLGIHNITCYGIWIDKYYLETFKDISFIDDYGKGLQDYIIDKL